MVERLSFSAIKAQRNQRWLWKYLFPSYGRIKDDCDNICFPHIEESKTTMKIVEVCKVAPPLAASTDFITATSTPKSVLFTFIDINCLTPILNLFFYGFPNMIHDLNDIVPRLKHSLSFTLHHFRPLIGNLTWPKSSHIPLLDYAKEDNAVSFIVVESNADFYHLSGSHNIFPLKE